MVDDHPLFADGLRLLLQQALGATIVDVQTVADALERLAEEDSLDVVLTDLFLPDDDGLDLLEAMRLRSVFVPVVVVSASKSAADVLRVFERGALGYVPKSSPSDEIVAALTAVSRGERYVAAELREAIEDLGAEAARVHAALTPRQLQTLRLLGEGLSNKEIAAALEVTPSTVKAHLGVVFHALQVDSRLQCVQVARELGLVDR